MVYRDLLPYEKRFSKNTYKINSLWCMKEYYRQKQMRVL